MSKILIDVDDVVADLVTAVYDAVGTDKKPEDLRQWDFLSVLSKQESDDAVELMSSHEFWSGLPPIDGAKKGVQRLKNFGHDVVWVTSPWEGCIGWEYARRKWIREHFGDEDIIITSAKEHVKGDAFIDDKPANVEKWGKANPQGLALLFEAPYNRDNMSLTLFKGWKDVWRIT